MGDSLRDRRAPVLPPEHALEAAAVGDALADRDGGVTPTVAGPALGSSAASRLGCSMRDSGPPTTMPSFPRTLGPHRAMPVGGEFLVVPRRRP